MPWNGQEIMEYRMGIYRRWDVPRWLILVSVEPIYRDGLARRYMSYWGLALLGMAPRVAKGLRPGVSYDLLNLHPYPLPLIRGYEDFGDRNMAIAFMNAVDESRRKS